MSSTVTTFKPPVQTQTKNQEATIYVGNLDEKVTEAILWELMVQVGPVVHVYIPRDRINQTHQGFGFVEFQSEQDADYACRIMNLIKLYSKPIKVNKATTDRKLVDVGANLFVGNLAPEIDERTLVDAFSTFGGVVLMVRISRDDLSGISKGYGFINFDNFESSDKAIECMNGQWLCNKPISVSYAFKKDGKGERHGTLTERLLASQAKKVAIASGNLSILPDNASTVTPSPSNQNWYYQ